MQIRVKLIATYRQLLPENTPGNTITIDVPNDATVADVLRPYAVPLDNSSVIVVNGLMATPDTPLKEGDEVSAFSAVAGG